MAVGQEWIAGNAWLCFYILPDVHSLFPGSLVVEVRLLLDVMHTRVT